MKKEHIFLCICSVVLLGIIIFWENREAVSVLFKGNEMKPVEEKQVQKAQDKRENTIVIDETGEKRKLYLEEVDTEKKAVFFADANPTSSFSQVMENHYYYMRSDGKRNYVIYKDKGEKVGGFHLEDGYVGNFLISGGAYYVRWMRDFGYKHNIETETKTALVNLKKKTINFLPDIDLINRCPFLYDQYFYIDWKKTVLSYDLSKNGFAKYIGKTDHMKEANHHIVIDSKLYYGLQEGKNVILYRSDLDGKQEEEILSFERKEEYEQEIFIDMDEEYIYCQDFIIPRSGGKMTKIFENSQRNADGTISFSYNKKYIFYIDKDSRIHRVSKEDLSDIILNNRTAKDVKCTEDGIYIQVPNTSAASAKNKKGNKKQETDDPESCDLYYMNLDGKNVEKLQNKG